MYELREGALRELDLETSAMECATFIGEYSETHAMEFPDFLEVVCTGAGSTRGGAAQALQQREEETRVQLGRFELPSGVMLGRASTRESHNQSRTRAPDITGARDADGSGGCGKPALHQNLTTDYAVVANLL